MIKREKYLRQLVKAKNNGFPKVITGIRRCGKSFLLKEIYREYLLSENIPENHIITIDLDFQVLKIRRDYAFFKTD